MAKTKAIFTEKRDWQTRDIGNVKVNPYLYFDGDSEIIDNSGKDSSGWLNGSPTITSEGVRGNAATLDGSSLRFLNVGMPAAKKYMISVWIKPTQEDLDRQFAIFATNRGDGWGNKGLHLSLNNDSTYGSILNARVYGSGATDMYTNGSATGRERQNFVAGKWYHIVLLYDQTQTYKTQVWVNGVKKLWTAGDANPTAGFGNSFTVGDMLGSGGVSQYPFKGTIDEMIYSAGDDCWSESEVLEYYEKTSKGEFVDYWTDEGSLELGTGLDGRYPSESVSWFSQVVDLGGKLVDYGRIQATGQLPSATTTLTFFTRTSADGSTWEAWKQVDIDGKILSTNNRYIQVRVDLQSSDGLLSPVLEELSIIEEIYVAPIPDFPRTLVKRNDPLYLYRDLETGLDSMGELRNAYDIIIEEQINGEDNLTFKMPKNDKKRKEVGEEPVEMVAQLAERFYTVKQVLDKREDNGKPYTEFKCEARWTELRDWYVDGIEEVEVSAQKALEAIVNNIFLEEGDPEFDWTIGHVEIQKKRTIRSDWNDVLSLVREVQKTWGGEVFFDTKNKVIHLLEKIGKDAGVRFYYHKNLKSIERTIDTYDLITRIYPIGKGELDIKTVNDGVPYLEDRTWVDRLKLRRKIIPYKWKDERYTIPNNLKEDGQKMLDEMSKPKVSYVTTVHDLSTLSGHEHESFELGDTVTAIDQDLFDEEIMNRIVRRKQDVRKPQNTEVELSQPTKTLADIQNRALDDQVDNLIASDPLSTTDAQQMTVFNQLLNSRGDDGFSYWVHTPEGTGFELANSGFSGSWSYKVTPEFDAEAQLTQTVEGVSHRSSYTISAAVATEGDITRGSSDDAFVGIKVLVYYEGEEQPEPFYLAIPDITENGGA